MDSRGQGGKPAEGEQVRDRLALIRTRLANERTFLAYLRSSLALFFTGVTSLHYLGSPADIWMGIILILLGSVCLAFGMLRLLGFRREIGQAGHGEATARRGGHP